MRRWARRRSQCWWKSSPRRCSATTPTTFEQVENLLDLGNAGAVLNAVLTGSGLKPRGNPLGEAVAVAMPGLASGDGWEHIYGLLATACGYTYPVIDAMTLLDVEELTSYWAEHPPVHILAAAYLGLNGQKRPRISSNSSPGLGDRTGVGCRSLLAELGPGFASGDVHAALAPVELDFAELRRKARDASG